MDDDAVGGGDLRRPPSGEPAPVALIHPDHRQGTNEDLIRCLACGAELPLDDGICPGCGQLYCPGCGQPLDEEEERRVPGLRAGAHLYLSGLRLSGHRRGQAVPRVQRPLYPALPQLRRPHPQSAGKLPRVRPDPGAGAAPVGDDLCRPTAHRPAAVPDLRLQVRQRAGGLPQVRPAGVPRLLPAAVR